MKCNKCGAERQKYQLDEGGCRTAETLPQCRDAISAQLASMTKRAEELEQTALRAIDNCDSESGRANQRFDDNAYHAACRDALKAQLAERDADVERLRDAVQLEISQRRVDDSYGRDKSACQTVSDILERRGNGFGLMSALAAARKETP